MSWMQYFPQMYKMGLPQSVSLRVPFHRCIFFFNYPKKSVSPKTTSSAAPSSSLVLSSVSVCWVSFAATFRSRFAAVSQPFQRIFPGFLSMTNKRITEPFLASETLFKWYAEVLVDPKPVSRLIYCWSIKFCCDMLIRSKQWLRQ